MDWDQLRCALRRRPRRLRLFREPDLVGAAVIWVRSTSPGPSTDPSPTCTSFCWMWWLGSTTTLGRAGALIRSSGVCSRGGEGGTEGVRRREQRQRRCGAGFAV